MEGGLDGAGDGALRNGGGGEEARGEREKGAARGRRQVSLEVRGCRRGCLKTFSNYVAAAGSRTRSARSKPIADRRPSYL